MDWQLLLNLASVLIIPGLVGGGFFIARMSSRVTRSETRQEQMREELAAVRSEFKQHTDESVKLLERVATMEANIKNMREDVSEIKALLQRALDRRLDGAS